MKRIIILMSGIFFCFYLGCQSSAKVDPEVTKETIKKFLTDFWAAYENKDFEAFSKMVAHENTMIFFGTDKNEEWAGWDAIKDAVKRQFEAFHDISIKIAAEVINVSESGNTAWFSCIRTIEVVDNKGQKDWMTNRVTGVLTKRKGEWKMVQYHSSAALNWDRFKY